MQIFCPSAFQAILRTTDLFLLLIISSYQEPDNGINIVIPRLSLKFYFSYFLNVYQLKHKLEVWDIFSTS